MPRIGEYLSLYPERVRIPELSISACLLALGHWAGTSPPTLSLFLEQYRHHWTVGPFGVHLDEITLDYGWAGLEGYYKTLAPFVDAGGRIHYLDDIGQSWCYVFRGARVVRISGAIVYTGDGVEL